MSLCVAAMQGCTSVYRVPFPAEWGATQTSSAGCIDISGKYTEAATFPSETSPYFDKPAMESLLVETVFLERISGVMDSHFFRVTQQGSVENLLIRGYLEDQRPSYRRVFPGNRFDVTCTAFYVEVRGMSAPGEGSFFYKEMIIRLYQTTAGHLAVVPVKVRGQSPGWMLFKRIEDGR